MQKRAILDDVRVAALTTLLDVQTLFGTLRHIGSNIEGGSETVDEDVVLQTQALAQEIIPTTQATISRLHDTAERALAKKLKKDLGSGVEEAPLESAQDLNDLPSDDEMEEDDDEDDVAEESKIKERLRATILAEQRLCEITGKIVLAIIGRVLDTTGPQRGKLKQKLLKNKTRLGHNYKEVVAFLEDRKARPASRPAVAKGKQPAEASANQAAATAKSIDRVDEEAEEEFDHPITDEDIEADLQADLSDADIADPASDEEEADQDRNEDEDEIMGD
jgi:cohesin complex subunit SA-1/2